MADHKNIETNVPTPEAGLIDEVPGVTNPDAELKQPEVRHGYVISIPEGEFRGDPSRVIGHPSNPTTFMRPEQLFAEPETAAAADEVEQDDRTPGFVTPQDVPLQSSKSPEDK